MNKFIKLDSGDMLASEVVSTEGGDVKLKNPQMIWPTETGITLVKYNMFGKSDTITIDETDILFSDELTDEVNEHYLKVVSKVDIPVKSNIITE